MSYQRLFRASVIVLAAGLTPLLPGPVPAEAGAPRGAADQDAHYYRQKSWVPVEISGFVKHVKQVHLSGSGMDHTVVYLEPRRGRTRGIQGRAVDLGPNREFRDLRKGDHLMVWGNTAVINDKPVVLADAAEINDEGVIEISRDPGFRKGHIWGRPLRHDDTTDFQNVDVYDHTKGQDWYFDSYEYVGYPYQEKPPGASAPWARGGKAWERTKERRDDKFERRYGDDDRYTDQGRSREDRMDRRSGVSKSDQQLKRDVESELTWSPFVDGDKVSVAVHDGIVTLNGKVSDEDEVRNAIDNAYEAGARQVVSKLSTED